MFCLLFRGLGKGFLALEEKPMGNFGIIQSPVLLLMVSKVEMVDKRAQFMVVRP